MITTTTNEYMPSYNDVVPNQQTQVNLINTALQVQRDTTIGLLDNTRDLLEKVDYYA
jgi:hypothetical protein